MIIRRIGGFSGQFQSMYPPAHSDTYVKATSKYNTSYWPFNATNPIKSLVGSWEDNSWISGDYVYTNQRFHIDLGTPKVIGRIYYENAHTSGGSTTVGVKNFIMQGSNDASAFAELTYATDTGWTQIMTGQFAQHVAANQADPQYILVPPHQAYRYFAFKIADDWGSARYLGLRRIVLQEMF